ncbi:MAG: hypothetical protein K2G36_02695 [Ruminococcus sp.]|nr:hypothetical protein [Ruminococcus sp.]
MLEMFDKLDDIIYAPVNAVCNWAQEPLRKFDHKREMEKMQRSADLQMQMKQQEAELQVFNQRQAVKIEADRKRWDAELEAMIADQEDKRRDRLVESIKNYQIDLGNAIKDIVESLGVMSLELRSRANNLLIEKTREYEKIQEEAMDKSMKRMEDIQNRFANNERVRLMMEDSIMNQMNTIVDAAANLIKELSEDLKHLNMNTDSLMQMGMKNIDKYLSPMIQSAGVANTSIQSEYNKKQLEEKPVIDAEFAEV